MQFRKVICTGGSGAIGQVFVNQMLPLCDISVLDLAPPANGVDFVSASMTDLDALRQAFTGQDAVVHLAAISNPRIHSQEKTFNINVQGTWAVMQAAEDAGVKRVVVASSDAATGLLYNPPDWSPQFLPIAEDHPLRPTEAYSLSKQVTEVICRSFVARGKLDVVLIRPTHVIFPEEYGVLRQKGADVNNYHLWTYVAPEDIAQGLRLSLALGTVRFDTFFLTAEEGLNERPTLDMLKERYGTLPEIRKPEIFKALPTASVVDISHAREVLGYEPTIHWRDMADKAS